MIHINKKLLPLSILLLSMNSQATEGLLPGPNQESNVPMRSKSVDGERLSNKEAVSVILNNVGNLTNEMFESRPGLYEQSRLQVLNAIKYIKVEGNEALVKRLAKSVSHSVRKAVVAKLAFYGTPKQRIDIYRELFINAEAKEEYENSSEDKNIYEYAVYTLRRSLLLEPKLTYSEVAMLGNINEVVFKYFQAQYMSSRLADAEFFAGAVDWAGVLVVNIEEGADNALNLFEIVTSAVEMKVGTFDLQELKKWEAKMLLSRSKKVNRIWHSRFVQVGSPLEIIQRSDKMSLEKMDDKDAVLFSLYREHAAMALYKIKDIATLKKIADEARIVNVKETAILRLRQLGVE